MSFAMDPQDQAQPRFDIHNAVQLFHFDEEHKNAVKELGEVLSEKAANLVPSITEQTKFVAFLTSVQAALDSLPKDQAVQVHSVKQNCLLKVGAMAKGNNAAKIIVILKSMPTLQSIKTLADTVKKSIQISFPSEAFHVEHDERSFTLRTSPNLSVECLVTSSLENFRVLDPKVHISERNLFFNYEEAEISKYLEQQELSNDTKGMIRLMCYLATKVKGLKCLQESILAMYVEYTQLQDECSMGVHFLRLLRLFASGILIDEDSGIPNRMLDNTCKLNSRLSDEEALTVTETFQKILNVTLSSKIKSILDSNSVVSL